MILKRTADRLDRVLGGLLALLLALTVLSVTWQVVSRYLLGDPSGWTEELARFLLIWIGLFGGAFAYHRRLHLGLDLLAEGLKSHSPRIQHLHAGGLDLCALLFAVTILIGGGTSLVVLTLDLEQFSPALGLPMAVVYSALPLSGLLMAIFALASLTRGSQDTEYRAGNH